MHKLLTLLVLLASPAPASGAPPTVFGEAAPAEVEARLSPRADAELAPEERRLLAFALIALCGSAEPPEPACVEPALARVSGWPESGGEDPELAAMRANLEAMTAAYARSPMQAMTIARQVQRRIDRLALDHPDHAGILLQRGANALHAPRVAGRWSAALADFAKLLEGGFDLSPEAELQARALHAEAALKLGRRDLATPSLEALRASGNPHWAAEAGRLERRAAP